MGMLEEFHSKMDKELFYQITGQPVYGNQQWYFLCVHGTDGKCLAQLLGWASRLLRLMNS